jgi:hypothetical protein
LASAPALAQAPFISCTTRLGVPIPSQTNDTIDAAGMAGYRGNQPMIWWNRRALENSPAVEQLFIYMHECAHHALNHPWKAPGRRLEVEADCWAVQRMVEGGMIAPADWDSLLVARTRVKPDDHHLGGTSHAASLDYCLHVRTDPEEWGRVVPKLVEAARSYFFGIHGLELEAAADEPQVWESTLGVPGTYDCEVIGTEQLRCLVFSSPHAGAMRNRYRKLVGILTAALPKGWEAVAVAATTTGTPQSFHARDPESGVSVSLQFRTPTELFFLVRSPPAS